MKIHGGHENMNLTSTFLINYPYTWYNGGIFSYRNLQEYPRKDKLKAYKNK